VGQLFGDNGMRSRQSTYECCLRHLKHWWACNNLWQCWLKWTLFSFGLKKQHMKQFGSLGVANYLMLINDNGSLVMDEGFKVDLIINMGIGVGGCGDIVYKRWKQLSHGSAIGIRLHRCGWPLTNMWRPFLRLLLMSMILAFGSRNDGSICIASAHNSLLVMIRLIPSLPFQARWPNSWWNVGKDLKGPVVDD